MPAIYTETTIPITAAKLAAMSPDSRRVIWEQGAFMGEQETDFYAPMEGGVDAIIQTKTNFGKGKGSKMVFDAMGGLYQEPHFDDETFDDATHYEGLKLNASTLELGLIRHGVAMNEWSEEYMGMATDISEGMNVQLGNWLGRRKSHQLSMMFRDRGAAANTLYVNGKSRDSLTKTDGLIWNPIVNIATTMQRAGGQPAYLGKDTNGNKIRGKAIVSSNEGLAALRVDPIYQGYLKEAAVRGADNPLYKGGYTMVDGNGIVEYQQVIHDGDGPIGSPLAPMGMLGVAVNSSSTTLQGGGNATAAANTRIRPWQDFPNYPYRWNSRIVNPTGSAVFYVLVMNPSDGSAGANKFNIYSCTLNNGRAMTITGRLVGAGTSVGGVTYNGLPAASQALVTTDHPVGATVVLCNSIGTPIGCTFFLCRQAARRGYGKYRTKRDWDEKEGREDAFIRELYIKSIFGQEPVRDAANRCPNYAVAWHALTYVGYPVPAYT